MTGGMIYLIGVLIAAVLSGALGTWVVVNHLKTKRKGVHYSKKDEDEFIVILIMLFLVMFGSIFTIAVYIGAILFMGGSLVYKHIVKETKGLQEI